MVDDPADYPWCGYGEVMGGSTLARNGLGHLLEEALWCENFEYKHDWRRTGTRYRVLLYQHGKERKGDEFRGGAGAKAGFSRKKVEAVVETEGKVPISTVLRCRVRYFCDGAVFGASEFVENVYARTRDQLGLRREPEAGPREMKGKVDWGDLRVMRDLRGISH